MTIERAEALAAQFKELFAKADKNQWELAEIAYQAIDVEGMKPTEFATLVGRSRNMITRYRATWKYREESGDHDQAFADVLVLANVSDEQAAAIHMVADANGVSIGTARNKTDEVAYYKDIFQHADKDTLKEALKDDDARSRLRELSVETVMDDQPKPPTGGKTPTQETSKKTKPPTPEEAGEKLKLQRAMAELMHFNRATQQRGRLAADALIAALPNMWWDRRFPGETVHRSHGEQVLGDLDKTIGVLTEIREELTAAIDGADAKAKATRQAAGLS